MSLRRCPDLQVQQKWGISMKQRFVTSLKPGMVIAENVFSLQGRLLISKGTALTQNMIEMLEANSIPIVKIVEEAPPAPKEEATSKNTTPRSYMQRVRESEEFKRFKKEYDEHIERFETSLNNLVDRNTPMDIDVLLHDTLSLLYQNGHSLGIMDMLMNVRDHDDITYTHSVNVALICGVFADWLQFTEEQKNTAIICGLFHDIGKLSISQHIIQKPARLTDEEFESIKQHKMAGYETLCKYNVNEHVRNAALMHHEKCDGSGYPNGLMGSEIDDYAKLVTIADIYDAMTSQRVYRDPICPFEVIREFENDGLQKYDPRYILVFLENVANSYLNQRVHLSNGKEGNIIFINRSNLSQPTIHCDDGFINLKEHKGVTIEYIL